MRNLPSLPAIGDVFTPKVIRKTGSSTSRRGSGVVSSTDEIVSPTWISSIPAAMKRSPLPTSSTSTRPIPANLNKPVRRLLMIWGVPSADDC